MKKYLSFAGYRIILYSEVWRPFYFSQKEIMDSLIEDLLNCRLLSDSFSPLLFCLCYNCDLVYSCPLHLRLDR